MNKVLILLGVALMLVLVLPSEQARAACASTITVKDGSGASITTCDTTDGGTGLVPSIGILGGANNANKVIVDGNGGLDINLLDLNGNAVLTGNGTTGTGSQRVTIASDNTAFTVNAAESGTWNITNISGTISLPTGAATSAKQPALGTAGAASADVISIQGIASMTPVKADLLGNAGAIMDFAGQNASSPANALLIGAQFQTTPTTVTAGNASPLQMDNAGNLLVNVKVGGGTGGTSSTFGAAFPATGTAIGAKNGANMVNLAADASNNLNINCAANCGLAQASTTSGQIGSLVMGAATTSPPTDTTANTYPLSLTTAGGLRSDIASVAGTATDVNSGTKSAGTLRVVLATDQPALTNKLLVTPDSVALPANQSVNVSQFNSVTPLMGNGTSGTGAQRVSISSDNTAVSGLGAGATGSAVPANAIYGGANVGGNTTGMIACGSSVVYDASTNGATQLVALASSQKVYVCGYSIFSAGTVNVELDYGTGTACATGNTKMTPAFQLTAQTGVVDGSPFYRGLATIASNELCIKTSAGVAVQAIVYYTQF